jgi:O-antigen/teichoic acid export membrane protein
MLSKSTALSGKQILQGFQWTYLSVVLQGALKLVALIVLARLLTPRDFGVLGFALLCTSFVERIVQGGVGPAVVQIDSATGSIATTAARVSVFFGFLSMIVLILSADFLANFFAEPELTRVVAVLSFGCLLEALAAIPEALLQRDLKCKEILFADNLGYLIAMLLVCPPLALMGWGVWSLVCAQLTLKLVRLIVLIRTAPPCFIGAWSSREAIQLTRTGFGFSLGRLLNFFSLQGDNFVVGRLLGTELLGIYNRAYQLMTLPAMYVGQVFERVMFPAMARKQGDKTQLGAEFLISLEAITAVALPAGVFLCALAPEIVVVGFGKNWLGVIPVLSVLSFGVFFRTAYKCSDTVARSLGAVYDYAGRQALYAALVISGAYVGAKIAGVSGVAFGVVLAVAINYLSMTRLSIKLLEIKILPVILAHGLGIWSVLCVAAALGLSLESLRASSESSLVVLLIALLVTTLAWCVSIITAFLFLPYGLMKRVREILPGPGSRKYHPHSLKSYPEI